jgi:plastocyanin
MKGLKIYVCAAFLAGGITAYAAVAYAAQHQITEKGKVFSQAEISIKVGDAVVFVNDDTIAHNVMSNDPANKFNLGLLKPGSSMSVTFNATGDILVICAIHPTMKMHVKVSK